MDLAEHVVNAALPLQHAPEDFDALLELVGDARLVLLGEASHGTHEFYRQRSLISRRLVEERGFAGIAVEGDWPDCARVNHFVRGRSADAAAVDALADFHRFPAWMWRNTDVLDLVGWLRDHNERRAEARQAGFFGLDLYSLHASMEAVLRHLERVDPDAAARARLRYACFDAYGEDPQTYGYAAMLGGATGCEDDVVRQLVEIRRLRAQLVSRNGTRVEDDWFEAERNAHVIAGAEHYYRMMFGGRVSSWNLRDTHMANTLDALLQHLDRRFGRAKLVVWAHNSHLGDARATEMGRRGEVSLGQLVRERHAQADVVSVGFTTSLGTVTAASDWGMPAERKHLRMPLLDSVEHAFHQTGLAGFYLDLRSLGEAAGAAARSPLLERFIGVVYRPETERQSHYSVVSLADQFDAVFHSDVTRALEPLERSALWERGEAPETWPTGL